MSDKRIPQIDKLVSQVISALPEGLHELRGEADQYLRAALHSAFSRLDLVTREEFDIQRKVLARTRARLEALEERVLKLENALLSRGKTD